MMDKKKPVHLLAGGRQSTPGSMVSLVCTVFKQDNLVSPSIAYIGVATGDDESFYQRVTSILRTAGACNVTQTLISPDRADLAKAKDVLASADIVFVSGGDVLEGIQTLREKNMVGFLQGLYEQGKPFFGNSAGSIMLAETWIRWPDPDDDSTAELFPCLGFAPIICDTHGEEDDWEELIAALKLAEDGRKGYGIVSGTAIKVHPDSGRVEALGGTVNQFVRREGRIVRLPDIEPTS
ncbi:Type 1 glutamine amidotransferase-like domain-containing protein [Candidatus Bathyarchaeota archaeon]|jgi:peptidase E|nr:Type 1 glutamine amidotransferase-like domain-containing protein [Candidatus Bathyarchaeota archaeon]